MFKIGEFSRLVQVPVATLRYYDQVGLLKPDKVDNFTGYRYYSASQLHRILALRGLGFSLEQIAEALDDDLTPEQMRGMLRLRHAQINQELLEAQNRLLDVEARLQQIEREQELSTYDVVLKPVETQLVALVRAIVPNQWWVRCLMKCSRCSANP
jgi:DNA-binding transcriptional MerR regulator